MTKEKFELYEKIRKSGKTNMLDVKKVIELSNGGLTHTDCLTLVANYKLFANKFKVAVIL